MNNTLPELPEPKYIYHASEVYGEDELFEFAETGAVDIREDGATCPSCERLYTADQMRACFAAGVAAERERAAQDAKRYRWLRDADACGDSLIGVYRYPWAINREWLSEGMLDAAIDAAIRHPETTNPTPAGAGKEKKQ